MNRTFDVSTGYKWNLQKLQFVGILKDTSESFTRQFLRRTLIYYSIALMPMFTFVDILYATNVSTFIQRTYLMAGFLIGVIKVFGFSRKIKEILEATEMLDKLRFQDEDQILKKVNKSIEYLGKKFCVSAIVFHVIFLTTVRLAPSTHQLAFAHFLEQDGWILNFGFLLTTSQTMLQIYIFSNIEYVTYAALYLIGAHFECIGKKLENIKKPTGAAEAAENVKILKEIVAYHRCVKGIANKIKAYCIPANLMGNFLLKIAAGTLTYYLTKMKEDGETTLLIFHGFLLFWTLNLLFVPNYFADFVTTKSRSVIDSAYCSLFYEQNAEFKKIYLIFHSELKSPVVFKYGGVFELSKEEFVKVCNAIYSFYTILKEF